MRTRLPTPLRRPRSERRGQHPEPALAGAEPEARVREAGGPEDLAHYGCCCGFQFEAAVNTSVRCPHCGSGQAW